MGGTGKVESLRVKKDRHIVERLGVLVRTHY